MADGPSIGPSFASNKSHARGLNRLPYLGSRPAECCARLGCRSIRVSVQILPSSSRPAKLARILVCYLFHLPTSSLALSLAGQLARLSDVCALLRNQGMRLVAERLQQCNHLVGFLFLSSQAKLVKFSRLNATADVGSPLFSLSRLKLLPDLLARADRQKILLRAVEDLDKHTTYKQ